MQLVVDPSIARFTRAELIAEMQDRFGDFTDGAFRDWQATGLIGAPKNEGRWKDGRTGSSKALWSGYDRQMLLALLEKREEHRRDGNGRFQPAELANLVVWSWAFWDEVIALDQAKLALRTWARPQLGGADGILGKEILTKRMRAAVGQWAAATVSVRARRPVVCELVDALWTYDIARLESLEQKLAALIDPDQIGRRVGAPGASMGAPEAIERLVQSQRAAHAVLTGEPLIPNKDWFAARRAMRDSWAEYAQSWTSMRARASTPELFGPPELSHQISGSSSTLLYLLGLRIAPA